MTQTKQLEAETLAEQPAAAQAPPGGRIGKRVVGVLIAIFLVVVVVYPLLWLLLGSFKTQFEFLNSSVWALPKHFNFDNYHSAFTVGHIGTYAKNSVLAVVPSLFLIVVLGTAAGFALEVMVFRGRGGILLLFLAALMVPGQMILLPLFTIYFDLNLTGTLWPLIITYTGTGLPLTVFMMATYFRAIPREMFEASTLDGASILRSFVTIAFPMARNSIATVAIVQFFFIWNDLLVAITFTNSSSLQTIQVGLLNFTGQYGQVEYGPLFAAISVNVIFMMVVFGILNQRILSGLAAGSVKG